MILGMEIALTVAGIMMLIRGKGIGKDAVEHRQYRLLGALAVSVLPVAFVFGLVFGVAWVMTHPDVPPEQMTESLRWPATGAEFGLVVLYAIGCALWDKAIRTRAAREREAMGARRAVDAV